MGNRRWTARECDFLARHYKREGAPYCAETLKRSLRATYEMAIELGISRLKTNKTRAFKIIKAMHAKGLNDKQIAALTGMTPRVVQYYRSSLLNLTPNYQKLKNEQAKTIGSEVLHETARATKATTGSLFQRR